LLILISNFNILLNDISKFSYAFSRTASGLIVFYWDEVLKHTESPSFHAKYLDSMK